MSLVIFFIITYLCGALSMAFLTLFERKVLGYMQLRKGPNKVTLFGLTQPLADVLKLLTKEQLKPTLSSLFIFFISPVMGLMLAFFVWSFFPVKFPGFMVAFTSVIFLCVSSMNVYATLLAGWSSNSKYALLGSLRAIAQTISYEVSMALTLLCILTMNENLEFNKSLLLSYNTFIFLFPLCLVWLITCLAETNRAPLDFAEGESEIVSGFNVEYSATPLAFILMAEYMNIIFMSMLTTILFFYSGITFVYTLFVMLFVFIFVWTRGSLPRMRYDKLMALTWKGFLPMSLFVFIFCVSSLCPFSMGKVHLPSKQKGF